MLRTAQLAADQAGAFLRGQEGRVRPADWTAKGRADYVTEVDREAERLIGATLREAFPDGTVVGEELSPESASSGLTWIVDPLDGTTNFLHRFPVYAVSIAAVDAGALRAAVVLNVPLGIRYTATAGGGAWQDGVRLHVSEIDEPARALIGTGIPFRDMNDWPRYAAQLGAVAGAVAGIRRPGSAALDLCDVAAGRYEGFWELKLAPWDIAAGVLLVREAGGVVTGLDGGEAVLRHGSLVAGNPAMHAWLMRVLGAAGGRP